MQVYYDDGSRGTTLYSRWLMSKHLGRTLDTILETVDHIDEDPTNDTIENLQLLTLKENAVKGAVKGPQITWIVFNCPQCGNEARKNNRYVKNNKKQGKAGPFCSRSCAGKYRPR